MTSLSRDSFTHQVLQELRKGSPHKLDAANMDGVEAGLRHASLFLREAVLFRNADIFLDNVTWFRRHMAKDQGRRAMLPVLLQSMKRNLACLFEAPGITYAEEYIDAALASLKHAAGTQAGFLHDPVYAELQRRYLDNLIGMRPAEAEQVLRGARDSGVSINDIYRRIIAPVQYEIGRLWEAGDLRVDQEHYCTETTRGIVERLLPRRSWFRSGKGAFVACAVGGEQHSIGARMVGDLFSLDGWLTIFLGGSVPVESLVSLASAQRNLVVGVSVTMAYHLSDAAGLISAIRESGLTAPIILGGRATREYPDVAAELGADLVAQDADDAIRWANERVEGDR